MLGSNPIIKKDVAIILFLGAKERLKHNIEYQYRTELMKNGINWLLLKGRIIYQKYWNAGAWSRLNLRSEI